MQGHYCGEQCARNFPSQSFEGEIEFDERWNSDDHPKGMCPNVNV
jgi:hypothetical protein